MYSGRGTDDQVVAEILQRLKISKGWFVDVGANDGIAESNTLGLVRSGWNGVLIEGDPNTFHSLCLNMRNENLVQLVNKWVSCEHGDDLGTILFDCGVPSEFDMLSIDVDGLDYWIWNSLTFFYPKVVVIEYNSHFEPQESMAVAYDPNHRRQQDRYYGASAKALCDLATCRGYTLVFYTECLNLFFVRNDLAKLFEPFSVSEIKKIEMHPEGKKKMIEVSQSHGGGKP
jgi:hypothetical protein